MDNVFKFKGNSNPKIKSKKDDSVLKFYYSKKDLNEPETFENFIKACEKCVRRDPRYKNYKHHLFENELNRCTFFGDITSEMAEIEMHHGPLFTLYDICGIVTDALLCDNEKLCTFDVAEIVMNEHDKENNVQIVMLCVTAHQLFHDGKIFIHYKQAYGDVMTFIQKYKRGLKREHLYTLNKYLELCENNDATDNDFLKVIKKIDKMM